MSSELGSEMELGNGTELEVAPPMGGKTVEDEAYEPTYAEAFPPLPTPETSDQPAAPVTGQWVNKLTVKRTTVTQVPMSPASNSSWTNLLLPHCLYICRCFVYQ